ncbi:MAG: hypothetical protein NVSMB5_23560 [Candidatus Velthaea sp.]
MMADKGMFRSGHIPGEKKNPSKGYGNIDKGEGPFFRGAEHIFHGPEMTITSPVGSVFNAVNVSKTNCMEQELTGVHHAGRGDTFGSQKVKGKKGQK